MKANFKRIVVILGYLGVLIAAITGFIQIYDRFIASPSIEVFNGNIYLTYSNSDTGLIDFLERNNGKIVYIDNFIDTSLSIAEQQIVEEQCEVDIDAILEKKVDGVPLSLPMYKKIDELICNGEYLVLSIGKNTTYEYSAGGTGMVMIRFKGFFEISTTYHSGPSTYYHLKEIEVPFEVKRKIANNR